MRILAALTLPFLTAVGAHAQPRNVQPAWTVALPAIAATAWSSTGKCVAVSTDDTVHVIDTTGVIIWKWEFEAYNRLIRSSSLAVSPSCDAVALVGDSSYKYVWIAQRAGVRAFFKTSGTPWVARFSLNGEVVAVTTGASQGYLLSRRAALVWSGPDRDLPVRWPSKAESSNQTTIPWTQLAKEDVEALFQGPFSFIASMQSDDGRWSVNWCEPNHGPGNGWIQVRGPGDRFARWSKTLNCPAALIVPGGDRIVALGALKSESDGDPSCEDVRFYVFDQEGRTLQSAPAAAGGYLFGTPSDGRIFVYQRGNQIQGIDLLLNAVWVIDTPRQYVVRPSLDRRRIIAHEPSGKALILYNIE